LFLKDFKVVRPNFEADQETLLKWIVNAHKNTRKRLNHWEDEDEDYHAFTEKLKEDLFRIGLGKNKIQKRGFQIKDCHHEVWEEMQIYNINSSPEGYSLGKRMAFFNEAASEVFEKIYPIHENLPPHLIHVTCTGYVAPSPAQKLVSLHSHGKKTTVTNAYHMGCYGAIPSIRMAMGHFSVEKEQTDIIHTEFCSLHMNPTFHTIEQLVVQSLFADGSIKYSLGEKDENPALKILGVIEQIIDHSTSKMTWDCNSWGFQMSISKDIPIILRRNLEEYLERLAKKSGKHREQLKEARYAIHPGGPKIIEQIAEKLELKSKQIYHSKKVLQNCGNMSSATLPHIWESMLKDPEIQLGELVVSLAFGPGLSVSGVLFEKR